MSPALEAAYRLATTLPKRTHYRKETQPRPAVMQVPTPEAKKEEIRRMDAERLSNGARKWTRKQISQELHVGGAVVLEVLGLALENRRGRGTKGWR